MHAKADHSHPTRELSNYWPRLSGLPFDHMACYIMLLVQYGACCGHRTVRWGYWRRGWDEAGALIKDYANLNHPPLISIPAFDTWAWRLCPHPILGKLVCC